MEIFRASGSTVEGARFGCLTDFMVSLFLMAQWAEGRTIETLSHLFFGNLCEQGFPEVFKLFKWQSGFENAAYFPGRGILFKLLYEPEFFQFTQCGI
jgi:hypothetical protein